MPYQRTGILLAAFGSSSPAGQHTLAEFDRQVRVCFPGVPVRWAFTSAFMRSRLACAGKKTDSVEKALCRMGFEQYTHVAVQSLHLIPGAEYEALQEEIKAAQGQHGPAHICLGAPLLAEADDVALAAKALLAHIPKQRQPEETVVCMGHGTWHSGAASYESLAAALACMDPRIIIGTLEGEHSIDRIIPVLTASAPSKVWLLPLLAVIGKHAETDMAGPGNASWRGKIEAAGIPCTPILQGTVEYAGFVRIWLAHLEKAMQGLG